jgi:hypothetical protein
MDDPNELVAALNHQVTDENGEMIGESETTEENPTAPEETTADETTPAEKPRSEAEPATQAAEDETPNLVEDEAGKRYVPETRFKEVYGKLKQRERELEAIAKAPQAQAPNELPTVKPQIDKADALEVEVLRATLPQFNPESTDYSEELDQMGYDIWKANPGVTRLEAARKALTRMEKLAKQSASVKAEARMVKSLQSDQGMTNRVVSREAAKPDLDSMSDRDMEAYLKEHGQWPE